MEESVKKSQKELMINLREESRDEFKVICKQLENVGFNTKQRGLGLIVYCYNRKEEIKLWWSTKTSS